MSEWFEGFKCLLGLAGMVLIVVILTAGRRTGALPAEPEPFVPSPPAPGPGPLPVVPRPVPLDVRDLIRRLADPDTREAAYTALVERGADVVPHLVAALANLDEPHPDVLAAALGRIGDARACPALEGMVIRGAPGWEAALVAAVSLGTADAARLANAALARDGNPFPWQPFSATRALVYDGIDSAAEADRITPEFREALLLPVLRNVGEPWGSKGPSAADAVVRLDRDVAARLLQSPEVLERGPDAVKTAFTAIVDAGLTVDPDVAMSYADGLPASAEETGPEGATIGPVLQALAASGHPRARERIEEFRSAPDRATRWIAVGALVRLERIDDAAALVLDRVAEVGAEGLTEPQRTYHLAWTYANSASHADWLAAHAETDAEDVERALRTISATSAADLLAAARRRYDALRVKRRTTGVPEDAYLDLDERLVDESWNTNVLLTEYSLAHAEHFRAPPPV